MLPADYPMVAPYYAAQRSELAKGQLGQLRDGAKRKGGGHARRRRNQPRRKDVWSVRPLYQRGP